MNDAEFKKKTELREKLSPLTNELYEAIKQDQVLYCWSIYWKHINPNQQRYYEVQNELVQQKTIINEIEQQINYLNKAYGNKSKR